MVAVLTSDRLYVANVGDSRAIVAHEDKNGSLQVKQLSEDHGIENEQELQRLMALGLDREQLKKSGRLGTQENTRSIGDYSIKGGYRDVDVLRYDGIFIYHYSYIACHIIYLYSIVMPLMNRELLCPM